MTIKDRETKLTTNIEALLSHLKEKEVAKLTIQDYIHIKSLLTNVNNMLTLKVTHKMHSLLKKYVDVSDNMLTDLNAKSANANGFDMIDTTNKVIVEIKAVIPINNGNFYGVAQRNSILDDAIKLLNGKRELANTSNYRKIIGLVDIGDKTDAAIRQIMKPQRTSTKDAKTIERAETVAHLKLLDHEMKQLDTESVWLYKIKI